MKATGLTIAAALLGLVLTAGSPAPAPSPSATPAEPDGLNPRSAIVLQAKNDEEGVRSEYDYLASHPCSGSGTWKIRQQALITAGKRSYDRLDVRCSTGGTERTFFFDITEFFGKF